MRPLTSNPSPAASPRASTTTAPTLSSLSTRSCPSRRTPSHRLCSLPPIYEFLTATRASSTPFPKSYSHHDPHLQRSRSFQSFITLGAMTAAPVLRKVLISQTQLVEAATTATATAPATIPAALEASPSHGPYHPLICLSARPSEEIPPRSFGILAGVASSHPPFDQSDCQHTKIPLGPMPHRSVITTTNTPRPSWVTTGTWTDTHLPETRVDL